MDPDKGLYFTGPVKMSEFEVLIDYSTDLYAQIDALYNTSDTEVDKVLLRNVEVPVESGVSAVKKVYSFSFNVIEVQNKYEPEVRKKVVTGEYVSCSYESKKIAEKKAEMGLRYLNPYEALALARLAIANGRSIEVLVPLSSVRTVTESSSKKEDSSFVETIRGWFSSSEPDTCTTKVQDVLYICVSRDASFQHGLRVSFETRKDYTPCGDSPETFFTK